MKRLHACAVALLVLAFAPQADAALAKLNLCNKLERPLLYAILDETHPFYPLAQSWEIDGWYEVPAGQCQEVLRSPSAIQIFLSVLGTEKDGTTEIMHFPFRTEKEREAVLTGLGGWTTGSVVTERFFCVRKDPFSRKQDSLNDHMRCPSGWYPQLFNLFVRVAPNTDYDIDIK